MRKIWSALFVTIFIFCVMSVVASAEIVESGTCGEALTWTLDDGGTLTISGEGDMTDWDNPSSVPWVSNPWNAKTSKFNRVIIENGVTSIGSYAFYHYPSLTSITIPESVQSIGAVAFYTSNNLTHIYISDLSAWCSINFGGTSSNPLWHGNLYVNGILTTKITIPDGVNTISSYAFAGYSNLTGLTLPESVTNIESCAFHYCENLADIELPNTITSIGASAFARTEFYENENNWQDNVLYIGQHLIKAKSDISGVYTIKDNTHTIADEAFYQCKDLTDINIPDSVVTIGSQSFELCSSLTNVVIPSNVKTINDLAFHGCSNLTDINIPDSCTSIGGSAIGGCQSLTNIFIPASVISIGDSAFSGSYNLTELEVDKENINYTSENSVLYNKDKTELLAYPSAEGNYIIPSGIKYIGNGAFTSCKNLINIIIPNSVVSIGTGAFEYCSNLEGISIPNSVLSLGDMVFYSCHNLVNIDLPDSISYIGMDAFANCTSLKHINIPKGMTHIEDLTFHFCDSLKSVYIPKSITSIGRTAFWCYQLSDVFYEGTKEEWNSIDIESGNGNLIKATIYYNAAGTNPPTIEGTNIAPNSDNTGKCLEISLDNTEYDSKLITVFSNGSIYNSFNLTDIAAGDTSKQIDIPENSKFAKLFIWDSLSGIKPLCEAQEITIE